MQEEFNEERLFVYRNIEPSKTNTKHIRDFSMRHPKVAFIAVAVMGFATFTAFAGASMPTTQDNGGGSFMEPAPSNSTEVMSSSAADIDIDRTATPAHDDTNTQQSNISVTTQNSNSDVSTDINVNGQNIPVPSNGSSHQVIKNDGSTTTITTNSSQAGSDNGSRTTTRAHISVHSTETNAVHLGGTSSQ